MNKITNVTRKRILDAISGYEWYGELSEPEFLNRIFDLHSMKSTDPRFKDMYGDIIQHRVNNSDYDDTWFITDSRLNLLNVADDIFVKFILQTIDPLIVRSSEMRDTFLRIYNDFLINDGYELIVEDYVSGEPVYKISKASENDLLYRLLTRLQSGCVDISTNGTFSDPEFLSIMQRLRKEQKLYRLLPQFVLTSHQTINIRKKMQDYAQHYAERRTYINEQFHPAFQYLETMNSNTGDTKIKTEDSVGSNVSVVVATENLPPKTPKIFISHSSKDKKVAEMLVDLIEKMGIPDSAIYCTSADGLGVSLRENIYASMRKQFDEHNLFVLFLLSHNYYQSAACLNEMGATWILKLPEISILLPGFDFSQIEGAVDSRNIGIKLDAENAGSRLTELREQLCEFMNISIPSSANSLNRWESKRNAFINQIKTLPQDTEDNGKDAAQIKILELEEKIRQLENNQTWGEITNVPDIKKSSVTPSLEAKNVISRFLTRPVAWNEKSFRGTFYIGGGLKHGYATPMSDWLCQELKLEPGYPITVHCVECDSSKAIEVFAVDDNADILSDIDRLSIVELLLKTVYFTYEDYDNGNVSSPTTGQYFIFEVEKVLSVKAYEHPQTDIPF